MNGDGGYDRCDEIDEMGMKEKLKAQIGYASLVSQYRPEEIDGLVTLMADVLSSPQATFRISGCQIRASSVRDRIRTLEQPHIEYVLDCMKKNTTKIRNIRSYLLTALYNAPVTMEHYYQAEVQHDLYGRYEAVANTGKLCQEVRLASTYPPFVNASQFGTLFLFHPT